MNYTLYRTPLVVTCIVLAGLSTAGCALTSEIARTKRYLETETDADFDPGVVVSIGPGLFQTAGRITQWVDDEDAHRAGRMVQGIRRIKAGVYPTNRAPDFDALDIPEMGRFKRKGWKTALEVQDDGERSWLLYRERSRHVNDLFLVHVSESELVLARIQGDLDTLLDVSLEEIERELYAGGWIERDSLAH